MGKICQRFATGAGKGLQHEHFNFSFNRDGAGVGGARKRSARHGRKRGHLQPAFGRIWYCANAGKSPPLPRAAGNHTWPFRGDQRRNFVDETLHQTTGDGTPFADVLRANGVVVGIKVDAGAKALAGHAGEQVTEGLDGLRERLAHYASLGARFAKWRTVLTIGDKLPSRACILVNAHALARYAALCQEAQLVPIVEPEVLMDGGHSLARCSEVTTDVLHEVFEQLHRQGVVLEGMLLKPNMVLPGLSCADAASVNEIADATLSCLRRTVPAAVAGIAFLSGGQSSELATERLNAMHQQPSLPWPLTFSFGRALQHDAIRAWAGADANRVAAQHALLHRARCNGAAARGVWTPAMETEGRGV